MRQLRILILMLIVLGQSCSDPNKQFENIVKSPDKFHNQEVEIIGVIHGHFTDSTIYLTNGSELNKSIGVNFSDMFLLLNTIDGLDGQNIKIKGTFNKNDKGYLRQHIGSLDNAIIKKE